MNWPRTYVLLAYRGVRPDGSPGKHPLGTVLACWEEAQYESMYAAGDEERGSNSATCGWWQRVDVASQEDLDALRDAISEKRESIDTVGIDRETQSTLAERTRFVNRGSDGRVRTVKGERTRRKASR